MNCCIYK